MYFNLSRLNYLKAWLLTALAFVCIGSSYAQRTSEKYVNLKSNYTTSVDVYQNVLDVNNVGQSGLDFDISITNNSGTYQVSVISNSAITGARTFTLEYLTAGNPDPIKNYRVYYLNFSPSIVKAADDLITYSGSGSLTIDVAANDTKDNIASIKINQKHPSATVSINANNKIVYNNPDFQDFDYIHYTITDSTGTSDQAIVKIELAPNAPAENLSYNFVVNYLTDKNITVPVGFEVSLDPYSGSLTAIDATHFLYQPAEYEIGQDSFVFANAGGTTITYYATIIDAERDPGIVKNDVYYTPKGQSITFDVFANDMTSVFPITSFSSTLTHDSLGVFTYTPSATTTGQKNFFYKINNGTTTETGTITIYVGNQYPEEDVVYQYEVLAAKDFVIEYDVPISGYSFTIIQGPNNGQAYTYVDSTEAMACGKAFGKAMVVYTAPSPGGVDTIVVKYCVNNQGCKNYKLIYHSNAAVDPSCNCIDNCVWSGDLNGDGRVSGRDLMVLGRYFGYQGSDRDVNAENIWTGDNSDDWGVTTPNGRDLKHADANGDGILNEADMTAIVDHFGKLNTLVPTDQLAYKDFQLTMVPDQATYEVGDTATIYFYLGTAAKPANGIHGLSFGIDMDDIDSNYLDVQFYSSTWLSDHSPILQLYKAMDYGKIRTAVTRTSGKAACGFGLIGQMGIIVEEGDGVRQEEELISFEKKLILDNIECEDAHGNYFLLRPSQLNLTVTSKKEENITSQGITVYPNPADQVVFVNVKKGETIHSYRLYDAMGRLISHQQNVNHFETQLDLSYLPSGVYFLKVHSDKGVVTRTVVKR